MRIPLSFLAIASLAGADSPAAPTRLAQLTFEQPMSAAGWRFYAWSRSLDPIPGSVVESDGGKVLRLDAIETGAIGISSKPYRVEAADTGWKITCRVKAADGYANNIPWLFVAACDAEGKFLPPAVDMKPAVKVTETWTTVTVEVARGKLPAGTAKLAFNLATMAVKDKQPAGALLIDEVEIEPLR